jgi:Archaeal/vacuolar-type H+-ATPase subunit B
LSSWGGVEYSSIREIRGPLMVVEGVDRAAYDELVEIELQSGERRLGRVLETGLGMAVVQVFEGTTGLSTRGLRARFLGKVLEDARFARRPGARFDGLGRPSTACRPRWARAGST